MSDDIYKDEMTMARERREHERAADEFREQIAKQYGEAVARACENPGYSEALVQEAMLAAERLTRIDVLERALAARPAQCAAILPNDRHLRVNDGWKNCCLVEGHTEPHRTGYSGSAACVGDPGWTFDIAAIERLPSPYVNPPTWGRK